MRSAIVGVFEDFKTKTYENLDNTLNGVLGKFATSYEKASKYKGFSTVTVEWENHDLIYIVGLGKVHDYDLNKHRKVIGYVTKKLHFDATILLDTFLPIEANITEYAFATSEAYHLAQHQHIGYKTDKKQTEPIIIEIESKYHIKDAVYEGELLSYSTSVTRDLLNTPANKLTPTDLALIVEAFADAYGLQTEILEKRHMERAGMGGILGVNQGSTENPKLITAKYFGGSEGGEILALVGKGVTYDTGGYSLKPSASMYGMHGDMGGAATVFGAFCAIVEAELPVNVILIIPSTDNMVSADSLKPGDVITMLNGMTVEVNNTDAEGRLILADALTHATNIGATRIINVATLTGAVVRALGDNTTGAFTNNKTFMTDFLAVAEASGESTWQLPIFEPEQKLLKSSQVADMKNAPAGPGAIVAAAFLKEFVEDETPWIHLDVAGTAETTKAHELGPKGATGVMVRTLFNYAKTLV
jgi:leucyl aminopeptidase